MVSLWRWCVCVCVCRHFSGNIYWGLSIINPTVDCFVFSTLGDWSQSNNLTLLRNSWSLASLQVWVENFLWPIWLEWKRIHLQLWTSFFMKQQTCMYHRYFAYFDSVVPGFATTLLFRAVFSLNLSASVLGIKLVPCGHTVQHLYADIDTDIDTPFNASHYFNS